jgi:hypothetical protein
MGLYSYVNAPTKNQEIWKTSGKRWLQFRYRPRGLRMIKIVLEFTGTDLNFLTLQSKWWWQSHNYGLKYERTPTQCQFDGLAAAISVKRCRRFFIQLIFNVFTSILEYYIQEQMRAAFSHHLFLELKEPERRLCVMRRFPDGGVPSKPYRAASGWR